VAARVHLIDGHVYIFRAWHSLPEMRAPDGTPTQAAYGFANTLIRHLAQTAPTHAAVCLDHDVNRSFRNQLFPDYKAQRGEPTEELAAQFPLCAEAARALGLAVFEREGFEADDLIGALAARLLDEGRPVLVVSGDKDLAQLVREDGGVLLLDLARGETLDAAAVRARFGVDPERVPDYLALVGDAVDNLPGVPGVGAKTAVALLRAFGPLERIPDDPAGWADLPIRGAARAAASLARHRERALLVRELATVRRRIPGLAPDVSELAYRGADRARFSALCERLGWGRIATRVPRWEGGG
jgi:DNA polymerase-1